MRASPSVGYSFETVLVAVAMSLARLRCCVCHALTGGIVASVVVATTPFWSNGTGCSSSPGANGTRSANSRRAVDFEENYQQSPREVIDMQSTRVERMARRGTGVTKSVTTLAHPASRSEETGLKTASGTRCGARLDAHGRFYLVFGTEGWEFESLRVHYESACFIGSDAAFELPEESLWVSVLPEVLPILCAAFQTSSAASSARLPT